MTIRQNNAKVITTCGQRLNALSSYVKTKTPMAINGRLMKPADLAAIYQNAIDTRAELIALRAAYEKGLEARDSADELRIATDRGFRCWVTGAFGENSQEAQEFGFLPPKVGTKTAQTKALAVEKNLATRKARGTKGKRQKQGIKGILVAPAAPAASADTASTSDALNGAPAAIGVTGSH